MEITILTLRKFRISGFKALDSVIIRMPTSRTMLIGMNGAGKSSTLQALSFVSYFARGKPEAFFEERGWNPRDVNTKRGRRKQSIRMQFLFEDDNGSNILWMFTWGLFSKTNGNESVWVQPLGAASPEQLYSYSGGDLEASSEADVALRGIKLQGSVLSLIAKPESANFASQIMGWASGIVSLELLSPSAMRGQSRTARTDIGSRGQNVSKFISQLSPAARSRMVERLAEFYPINDLQTVRKRAGWVNLTVAENFRDYGDIGIAHVSDGFLRLLALCAIPEFPENVRLILLDEVEDGIDPHILSRVITRVTEASQAQFVITSHSPTLVNFMETNEVTFMGRSPDGRVRAAPFETFDTVEEGLEFFGSGELWAMMNQTQLLQALENNSSDSHFSPGLADATAAHDFMHDR